MPGKNTNPAAARRGTAPARATSDTARRERLAATIEATKIALRRTTAVKAPGEARKEPPAKRGKAGAAGSAKPIQAAADPALKPGRGNRKDARGATAAEKPARANPARSAKPAKPTETAALAPVGKRAGGKRSKSVESAAKAGASQAAKEREDGKRTVADRGESDRAAKPPKTTQPRLKDRTAPEQANAKSLPPKTKMAAVPGMGKRKREAAPPSAGTRSAKTATVAALAKGRDAAATGDPAPATDLSGGVPTGRRAMAGRKAPAEAAAGARHRAVRLKGVPAALRPFAEPVIQFLDARVEERRTDADGRRLRYEHRLSDDGETLQIDLYFGPRVAAELDIRCNGYRWLKLGGDEKKFRSHQSFLKACFNLKPKRAA